MTHKESIEKLLRYNAHFKATYDNLRKWNKTLSRADNFRELGMVYITGYKFVANYKLKYKDVGLRQIDYKKKANNAKAKYVSKWKCGETIKQNAQRLRITLSNAYFIARRYSLPYLKVTKRVERIAVFNDRKKERTQRMKLLSEMGFNQVQIGKIIGISRERVRQLIG